jgi:uncharacterized protein Yka (UPF0111/DUF47 family)
MSSGLREWLENRRRSRTLELAQLQMTRAIETVSEFEIALNAFCEGNYEKANQHLERLFQKEIEVDELRRAVFEEMTRGELSLKFREDLKSLVGRLDRMADHVKDSARAVKILIKGEATIPKQMLKINQRIAKNLVECTRYLSQSIDSLGSNPVRAREFTYRVDEYEGIIDEDHLTLKIMFIQTAGAINAPTLVILKDLAEAMERAADMCDDTADYVRTLAIAET